MAAKDDATRLSIEHMATSMYGNRVAIDKKQGKEKVYADNPDARALYFKGVHDTIECIETWLGMEVKPETLAMFIEALHQQTAEANEAQH